MYDDRHVDLSDSRTVGQSDSDVVAFDVVATAGRGAVSATWAALVADAAAGAACAASAEDVRSLRVIAREASGESDPLVWESLVAAWQAGVLEACGNVVHDVTATALWESATADLDFASRLAAARPVVDGSMAETVAAIAAGEAERAARGMREHADAVRSVLASR